MPTKRTTDQLSTTERPSTKAKARQVSWTAVQKLALLSEYEAYPKGNARRGEFLRQTGLYTSHLFKWRPSVIAALFARVAPRPAERSAQPHNEQHAKIARLKKLIWRERCHGSTLLVGAG
jgi:hypothetical protein